MGEFESINFKRGFLVLVILSLLKKEEMYGLQIIEEASERSHGLFTTQIGSLYPAIYRLLDGQYISVHEVPLDKHSKRIYYKIEDRGLRYLDFLMKQFFEVMEGLTLIIEEAQTANE